MSPKVVLAYFNSELCAARKTKSFRKKFLNYSAGNHKKINSKRKNFFPLPGYGNVKGSLKREKF